MQSRNYAGIAIVAGLGVLVAKLWAQTPATGTAPGAASGASGGQGRGGGRGGARRPATFPAQHRPPGDPVIIAHGKTLYVASCQSCHGEDLRGSGPGAINLLRSQVVLSDKDGELIRPVIEGSRKSSGMPAINMAPADIEATATFIHSVVATAKGQGAPPAPGVVPPSALVGDASAGQQYFAAKCSSCHSPTGDLQGIGTRISDVKALQKRWVSGGGGGRAAAASSARIVTATVTMPSGERFEGRLVRVDDFLITLSDADGAIRSFRRDGEVPKIEIKDPMQTHRSLWPVYTDKDMHDVTAYLASLK